LAFGLAIGANNGFNKDYYKDSIVIEIILLFRKKN